MASANRNACKVQLREEILEVAGRQFFTRGYEGVSLNSVAREARLYPATLRLYFPDKESLYLAVAFRARADPATRRPGQRESEARVPQNGHAPGLNRLPCAGGPPEKRQREVSHE